jgi:glutathione S-transferase
MAITMYDLAGADPSLRFSPYCWRSRMALAHKGLPVETLPWRFVEKQRLAFAGSERVPVIADAGRSVADSWNIAEYLEQAYPDHPSLFGGPGGRAHARFINAWADQVMIPAIVRLLVLDIWRNLDPGDQPYFRASREARFGASLEAVVAGREARLPRLREALAPPRAVLGVQPWLGGDGPSYADYIVFGQLQWARCISRFELLAADDPLAEWRGRMLTLFDGLAGSAATV